jgi:hypothetical protein
LIFNWSSRWTGRARLRSTETRSSPSTRASADPGDGGLLVVGTRYMKNFLKTTAGDTIQLTQSLMFPWENIDSGFGSVCSILDKGHDSFDPKLENIPSYLMGRAARTAVGITAFTIVQQPIESGIGLTTLLLALVAWRFTRGRRG